MGLGYPESELVVEERVLSDDSHSPALLPAVS